MKLTEDPAAGPRECVACDVVLIAVGLVVGGLVVFMAVDLASGGRLSEMLTRGGRAALASVTEIKAGDDATG
jgi:hypothetical protein